MSTDRKIAFIGLGNPGKDYENTRHNAGFLVVEALASAEPLKPADQPSSPWKTKKDLQAEIATTNTNGYQVILVKPTTFMNLSGKAIAAVKRFYDLEDGDIWIIHDDLDLPL